MRLDTKPGEKVRFLNKGGYEDQRRRALHLMVPGEIYEVEHLEVGSWFSYVTLKYIKGSHNSVMFENVEETY